MSQEPGGAGIAAEFFDLRNPNGLHARLSSHGARLVEMHVPDRHGSFADVVLGFDRPGEYVDTGQAYFGCTVGRVASRIARASFVLDGTEYRLAANDGRNHLHGGAERSFDKVLWHAEATRVDGSPAVRFEYTSAHLEEGYPGTLRARVTYALTPSDELRILYSAETDAPCPVNLTNHSYWNLAGAGSGDILDHELTILADSYTPVDDELIPTGEVAPVAGTPLDFREPTRIGARIDSLTPTGARGYDDNWVLRGLEAGTPPGTPRPACRLRHPPTGRTLEILTTEPAVQFYSGNFLTRLRGKGTAVYDYRGGLCLETQRCPDAVHHPAFPSIILRPGTRYIQTTVHRFSVG